MGYESTPAGEPVFLINGSPGCSSLYLREPHKPLIQYGFKLYSWDQLGCGESDIPSDPSLWTVERYIEETEYVRKNLGIEKFHLLGHSWGGMLAMGYALRYPQYLKSLILSNTTANVALAKKGVERLKAKLEPEVVDMMVNRELEGTTDHSEYINAKNLLYQRHVCRLGSLPDFWDTTINQEIRDTLLGPSLFQCTGSLASFNVCSELERIKVPTLILQGEHDGIIPECAQEIHTFIKGSSIKIFKNASHTPFLEAPYEYFEELISFLKKHS